MIEGIITDSDGISWLQVVQPGGGVRVSFLGRLPTASLEEFADKTGILYFGSRSHFIGDRGFQSLHPMAVNRGAGPERGS
jgi:hypothetical protein